MGAASRSGFLAATHNPCDKSKAFQSDKEEARGSLPVPVFICRVTGVSSLGDVNSSGSPTQNSAVETEV